MIFFEIILFIISIFLLSLSISGYGRLINIQTKDNLFLNVFLGFIFISFIVTIFHFFFKINILASFFIFIFGLIFFLYKINTNFLRLFEKRNIFGVVIILLYIPMFISQKYHEDFGFYHLPYALGFLEEKIVFGYANIDKSYVYNSVWLNLYSIFFLNDKNFNFLTIPSYILFLSFILYSINQIILKKNILTSDYFLITTLFYLILKFTRISEFGVDLPSLIFSILGIYYFIKFYETNLEIDKKNYFYLNLIFSVFGILIKLSVAPIILLSIILYFKNFRLLKFFIFNQKFLVIYFLILFFFLQQFIYTGCLFFPNNLTCLDVSWFNYDYLKLSSQIELINKSYSIAKNIYSPSEYLSNYIWFPFWLKRNYIEILEHLTTIILPVLLFAFCLKKKDTNKEIFNEKKFIYLFVFLSLIFWLNFSPVYRFGAYIFVTLAFLILLNLLVLKEFSKKIFVFFVAIFLLFSFSKNILRVKNTNNIFLGIQKIENLYKLRDDISNEYAKIYYPDIDNNKKNGWQGRLCWNTPFICSYQKLDVRKKNGYLIINKIHN
tara:strand:+ start:795 stop:2444 length:1650 start_codon:yes stop_codon:yes gene_type:complete